MPRSRDRESCRMPSAAFRAVDDAAAHLDPEMERQAWDESGAVTYLVRGDQIRSVNSCAAPSHRWLCRLMKVLSVEAVGFRSTPHRRARTRLAIPNAATPSIRLTRESPSMNTIRFSSDLRRCLSPPKPDLVEQPHRLGQSPAAGSGQPTSRHQSFTTANEAPAVSQALASGSVAGMTSARSRPRLPTAPPSGRWTRGRVRSS